MRLLVFSDLHRNRVAARRILELSRDADVVIGAGDFATVRRGLGEIVQLLARIDKPTVLVPGNAESFEELQSACIDWPSAVVLHGTGTEIAGVTFWGLGGAVPRTPFGSWSYDFTEEEATERLRDCPLGCVLVTHSPPKGLLDSSSDGRNLGSTAILGAIARCRPQLVVCGHIHERSGRTLNYGRTRVVNAGPAGMWIELKSTDGRWED